jgi:mannosyltransferase
MLTDLYSDPFVAMARSGKKYGYTMALWELSNTAPSLFRVVSEFKKVHLISSTPIWKAIVDASWVPWPFRLLLSPLKGRNSDGDAWNWCHFWSNFEIASFEWFRSPQYRQFFEHLDQHKGFYYERVSNLTLHVT